MPGFIDPPSPLASLADWEAFLQEMRAWNRPGDWQVREAIKEAKKVIAKKRAVLENRAAP